MQLLVLGFRVGLLISISIKDLQFWYLCVAFMIKRLENGTQVMWIGLRRAIYKFCPNRLTEMKEYSLSYRGRNGAYMEHLIYWLLMYYWLTN